MQNKTVSLPKSYRTLETFGMFFTLNNLGIAPFPTEIVYLAQGNQMYLSCRSPKTQDLRVHPVKASDHPWVRLTKDSDHVALQAPVSIPLTEEQMDRHVSVNQEMSVDNEFAKDLAVPCVSIADFGTVVVCHDRVRSRAHHSKHSAVVPSPARRVLFGEPPSYRRINVPLVDFFT